MTLGGSSTTSADATGGSTPVHRFRVQRHRSAVDLLDALSREQLQPFRWYRGDSDVRHGLIPRSLRPEWRQDDAHKQRDVELALLHWFARSLDDAGLPMPGHTSIEEVAWAESRSALDYPNSWYRLAALAQHHGVPTRLLDWSRDAKVAAYFAATNAVRPEAVDASTDLYVWVLNQHRVDHAPWHLGPAHPREGDGAHIGKGSDLWGFTLPASTSPFLHAQGAAFTVRSPRRAREAASADAEAEWRRWWRDCPDQAHVDSEGGSKGHEHAHHVVHTLPSREALTLLAHLEAACVTKPRLQPSLSDCAEHAVAVVRHMHDVGASVRPSVPERLWGLAAAEGARRGTAPAKVLEALLQLLPRGLGGTRPDGTVSGWSETSAVVALLDERLPPRRDGGAGGE